MASSTTATTSATSALDSDDPPRWRVEHASTGTATCNQAQCKSNGTKIEKGELRVGTWTLHTMEGKYFWAWRHWRCATPHQIRGLKEVSGGDVAKVPGYERISEEGREQLELALEEGKITDKDFQDIRPDLVKSGGSLGEIRDALGYKVELSLSGRAGCRAAACKEQGAKIAKGELRLGILRPFDGEHATYAYKHWKCISKYDLSAMNTYAQHEAIEGIDNLPEEYEAAVLESLEQGEVIVPPKLDVSAPKKKSRAKNKTVDTDDNINTEKVVSKKKARKEKSKKADVGKESSTGEATSGDTSGMVKTEDADQDPGVGETVAKGNSRKRKTMEDANEVPTTGHVTPKGKPQKKRKQNAHQDVNPGPKEAGGEFAVQIQAPEKRGTVSSDYIPPAERQAQEKHIGNVSMNPVGSVGDTSPPPLRRSARQAARAADNAEEQAENATSRRFNTNRKNTAAPVRKGAENFAMDMVKATPEKNQKRTVAAAGNASKENRKGKVQITKSKRKGDRKAAAAASKAEDNVLDKAGEAVPKKTPNVDEDVGMTNIAELREFMRQNELTRRLPRY